MRSRLSQLAVAVLVGLLLAAVLNTYWREVPSGPRSPYPAPACAESDPCWGGGSRDARVSTTPGTGH